MKTLSYKQLIYLQEIVSTATDNGTKQYEELYIELDNDEGYILVDIIEDIISKDVYTQDQADQLNKLTDYYRYIVKG